MSIKMYSLLSTCFVACVCVCVVCVLAAVQMLMELCSLSFNFF